MPKNPELELIDRRLSLVELGIKKLDKSIKDLKLEVVKEQKMLAETISLLKFLKELEKPNE